MFRSWVVLLLIGCAALAVALPHHLSFEQDLEVLEKGLDEIAEAEEEEDEDEDENGESVDSQAGSVTVVVEEQELPPLMLAMDCGSSGSKFMLFAKLQSKCPNAPVPNPSGRVMQSCDGGIKFMPTMTSINLETWTAHWSSETSGTTRLERATLAPYVAQLEKFIALATAGNRIIPAGSNTTAWSNLRQAVAARYSGLDLTTTGTIPGTHEAWLEFRAANGDFVSMGGASAQMGMKLDTESKLLKWSKVIKRASSGGSLAVTMCNNQNNVDHFFITLSDKDDYGSVVRRSAFASKCATGKCVGLLSWLAIKELGGQSGDAGSCATGYGGDPTSVGRINHWAGGIDQSIAGFETFSTATDTKKHCWGGAADATKCVAHMVEFSRYDVTTENVRRFVQGCYSSGDTFGFRILAALSKALQFYVAYGDAPTVTTALRTGGKGAGKARFALWGVSGILVGPWIIAPDSSSTFFAFVSAGTLSDNPASWIQQAAKDAGYGFMCPMVLLQESNASDEKALDDCEVDLARTE